MRSIINRAGGKQYMIKYLLPFPKHTIYVEMFGGGLSVLLNKAISPIEVVNDIDNDLMNFWMFFRDQFLYFNFFINYLPDSREIFENFNKYFYNSTVFTFFLNLMYINKLKNEPDNDKKEKLIKCYNSAIMYNDVKSINYILGITQNINVEEAVHFYYKVYHSFASKMNCFDGISFSNADPRQRSRSSFLNASKCSWGHNAYLENNYNEEINNAFSYMLNNLKPDQDKKILKYCNNTNSRFIEIWKRIKKVKFECQDFKKLFKRVDKKGVLIYCDPPYYTSPQYYTGGKKTPDTFTENDHHDLFNILKNLKNAKFVLSIDNTDIYQHVNWYQERVKRFNAMGSLKKKQHDIYEYIIRNFDNDRIPKMNAGNKQIF